MKFFNCFEVGVHRPSWGPVVMRCPAGCILVEVLGFWVTLLRGECLGRKK